MIKSCRSLVFSSLLLLLPNLQFHLPPSPFPVWLTSTKNTDFKFYPHGRTGSGLCGWDGVSEFFIRITNDNSFSYRSTAFFTFLFSSEKPPAFFVFSHLRAVSTLQVTSVLANLRPVLHSPIERERKEKKFLKHCEVWRLKEWSSALDVWLVFFH